MADITPQGPTTFALPDENVVGSAAVPQIGAPTAQGSPLPQGLHSQAPGLDGGDAKTFKAISDLASGMLASKVKEAAQEQFVRGVQQAMTGESLGEIVKKQPWYTDIFAPSSALAGARTYTAQAAVAQWAGKMQEQMPALAKQSPEELQKAATGALQGFMTGDPAADAMMTNAVVEHMAPLFKQHAKEHYIYVQKQATEAQINAWESFGKVYQGFAAAEATGQGTVSPEDKEAAKQRLLGAITPFADQSDDAFERNISAFLEGSATAGNFQVVKLFKDTGLYDKINPDKRATLDRALKVAARNTLDKAMPTFAVDIAKLVNDVTQNPADIPAKVQALNARVAAYTGVTEADMIPLGALDNVVGHVMNAQAAAAAAAARNVPSPDTGPAMAAALMDTPGALDSAVKVGLVKETDAERAGLSRWNAAKSPEERAKVLNSRTLSAFDAIKSEAALTLRSEEYQPGVGTWAKTYQGMAENVKPLYFSESERALMDRFGQQVRAGMPPEAAWVVARSNPNLAANMIPSGAKDELSKAIRSHVESENENFLGINSVTDSSLRLIEAATMRAYKQDRANNPPDVAAKRAYAQARKSGLDIQGKHAVLNVNPNDRPLFAVVGEGEKATAKAFEDLMDEKAKALGVKLDNYEAIRVPDRNGTAYIYVSATNDEGKTVNWSISSGDLKARIVSGIKAPFTGAVPTEKRSASGVVTDWTPTATQ